MILPNGRNLVVGCDADGCAARFFAKLPTELKALLRGVGGVDADVDPDFVMDEPRARRQARHKGWATVVDGRGDDFCPKHAEGERPILKTRTS
jgi:hypothetical protein